MGNSRARSWPAVLTAVLAGATFGCGNEPIPGASVSSVTHPQGVIQDSVPAPHRPFGLAVSAQGVVYVALLDTDTLGRDSLPDRTLSAGPIVGAIPSHVAFNPAGTTAYSSNQGTHDLSVVDVAANRVTATVPLSSDAWNVLVSPDGKRLFATTDQGALFVINTATDAIVASFTLWSGDALRGLAIDRDGRWLYVGGTLTGHVYLFDATADTVARALVVGGKPQHMAVSRDGSQLYVADETLGMDVVTLATGAVRPIALAGGGYGLALSPDDAQLYVSIPSMGLVQIVDRATGAVLKTLPVGGRPRGIAFTPSGAQAIVANEQGWITFVR